MTAMDRFIDQIEALQLRVTELESAITPNASATQTAPIPGVRDSFDFPPSVDILASMPPGIVDPNPARTLRERLAAQPAGKVSDRFISNEVVDELFEHLKLKYMGSCKCGECQLVPTVLIAKAATAIIDLQTEVAALRGKVQ